MKEQVKIWQIASVFSRQIPSSPMIAPTKEHLPKRTSDGTLNHNFILYPRYLCPCKIVRTPNNELARMNSDHLSLSRHWQSIAYAGSRDNLGKSGALLTINIQQPMPYKRCTLQLHGGQQGWYFSRASKSFFAFLDSLKFADLFLNFKRFFSFFLKVNGFFWEG